MKESSTEKTIEGFIIIELGRFSFINFSAPSLDWAYFESIAFSTPNADKCINFLLYFLHSIVIFCGNIL